MTDSIVRLTLDYMTLLNKYGVADKLLPYFELLKAENRKINLVSRETIEGGLETLAAESLLPFEKIEHRAFDFYLDIGSGGGFPALPIILTGSVQKAILIERASKKSLALERMVKGLGLEKSRFRVEYGDFEHQPFPEEFDLITMRLVKLTPKILRKIHSVLRAGGHFIYFSGVPESIFPKDFVYLSYCYGLKSDSSDKQFTIFTKN